MITVVYFWQIKKVFLPIAILFMAIHKFVLMRLPGVSFVKLLGTGKGESFTPKDANPYRWGALVTIKENHLD
ncbi:MAG: spheroidene monooxygenase, partial [Actinomycetota bacterium]|nr:spheroidene monooxygenase [Actinomycetota bacterium]